jgi:hypothetical protein
VLEELFNERRRDSEPGRGVFAIRDDQVNSVLVRELWQTLFDNGPAWPPKNVANKQDSH